MARNMAAHISTAEEGRVDATVMSSDLRIEPWAFIEVGAFMVSMTVPQARDLVSKLGSALYDYDINNPATEPEGLQRARLDADEELRERFTEPF